MYLFKSSSQMRVTQYACGTTASKGGTARALPPSLDDMGRTNTDQLGTLATAVTCAWTGVLRDGVVEGGMAATAGQVRLHFHQQIEATRTATAKIFSPLSCNCYCKMSRQIPGEQVEHAFNSKRLQNWEVPRVDTNLNVSSFSEATSRLACLARLPLYRAHRMTQLPLHHRTC